MGEASRCDVSLVVVIRASLRVHDSGLGLGLVRVLPVPDLTVELLPRARVGVVPHGLAVIGRRAKRISAVQ